MYDGNYQYSIKNLSKAIELDPELIDAYLSRGRAYTELDKHAEAIDDYTKVIELNPESVTAYLSRGIAYLVKASTTKLSRITARRLT